MTGVDGSKNGQDGYPRLTGKVAVVTGAASGLGRAIALAFGREGAAVVAADRTRNDDARGRTVAGEIGDDGGRGLWRDVDVRDADQMESLMATAVAEYGQLDVVCNNAGILPTIAPSIDLGLDTWRDVVDTNLNGVWYGCRSAIRVMLDQPEPRGCVINMSSRLGLTGAGEGRASYCATKGGVSNLTRQLAVEYGPRGVRVNAICPGFIPQTGPELTHNAARIERARERTPHTRLGRVEDVAALAVFLASDEAEFINGQNILVDGGASVVS